MIGLEREKKNEKGRGKELTSGFSEKGKLLVLGKKLSFSIKEGEKGSIRDVFTCRAERRMTGAEIFEKKKPRGRSGLGMENIVESGCQT